MMNSFEFLIIYLTCGAPLGVFYFLQYRDEQNRTRLWFKTFSTFIFWLPFGFHLLKNKTNKKSFDFRKIFSESEKIQIQISTFQKQLEEILHQSDLQISIFEFREVFDRYVGLTLAKDCGKVKTTEPEKEIFQIANNGNTEIGVICLNRRNLKRLTFHQSQARQDFFQVINLLVKFASDEEEFVKSAAGLFQLLKDDEAQSAYGKTLLDNSRNKRDFVPERLENYLWNTEVHKPLPAKSPPTQMQTLTATATLSSKD
jgi:hypothetical protein